VETSHVTEGSKARAELLSVAVSDKARGKGIGKKLVQALDEQFLKMGVREYSVVTHGIDERSNQFYIRCGFEFVRSFENHGKPMKEYRKVVGE
jgi:N-acetylglutamate synthase-like GNAT family acetyltransferase